VARRPQARLSLTAKERERRPSGGVDVPGGTEVAGLRAASEAVIYGHVFLSPDREVGGVLVGRLAADGGLPLVTGAIPALRADEQRATLTFTHETWAHVHRILESEFPPDEQIVGWYHSHPGFGVFLSGHDLFIHENFFTAPSQIAVVIDPHARREGVFAWQGPQLIALFERATPSGWVLDRPALEPRAGGSRLAGGEIPVGRVEARPARVTAPRARDEARRARVEDPLRYLEDFAQGHTDDAERAAGGHPLLALTIAALIGVIIGFGIWSLAAGVAGAQAPPAHRAAHVRIDQVRVRSPSASGGRSGASGERGRAQGGAHAAG
jgi:proteasome lid subunit RPN8/RPN11